MHREHPSLRIIIREESTQELDEGLRSGRLDMIISTPEEHPAATEASRGLDVHIARIDDPLAERTISLLQLASKGSNSESEILVQALRDGVKSLIQGL